MCENKVIEVQERQCSDCVHWSKQVCVDENNAPVPRNPQRGEPFWIYELCKKNWGLPQNAYISAVKCHHYKEKK